MHVCNRHFSKRLYLHAFKHTVTQTRKERLVLDDYIGNVCKTNFFLPPRTNIGKTFVENRIASTCALSSVCASVTLNSKVLFGIAS